MLITPLQIFYLATMFTDMLCDSCKNVERAVSTFYNVAKMSNVSFYEKCLGTIIIVTFIPVTLSFNIVYKHFM